MARLERFQKKQIKNTIVYSVVALILVLVLVSTLGFKLVLNTSTFIAGLFPKPSIMPLNKKENLIGSVNIEEVPQATNSARIIVSGTVVNFEILKFYINETEVDEIQVNADYFRQEIGDLKIGLNSIYVKAFANDMKEKKQTITYQVVYKSEKPKLEISEPVDKSTLSVSEILIKGSTDKETLIRVNDGPVVVDASGNFVFPVRLKEGENQITITATDIAGNVESKTITVIYQKD